MKVKIGKKVRIGKIGRYLWCLDPLLEGMPEGGLFCDACLNYMAKIVQVLQLNRIGKRITTGKSVKLGKSV
jgi:hypothetical protein